MRWWWRPRPPVVGPAPPQGDQAEHCLIEINEARKDAGLQPLGPDHCLSNQAQQHAEWMARNRKLTHAGFSKRIQECGGGAGSENVAYGYQSGKSVVFGWMQSPGHKQNILGNYRTCGVGYDPDGHFWCTLFRF